MDILRFGPGLRHAPSDAGSQGLQVGAIWSDRRLRITELSLARRSLIAPQSSPLDGVFIVIAGGGWVLIDSERSTINHGEAVAWPAGVEHAAWTADSTMRAILVEVPRDPVAGDDRGPLVHLVERPDPDAGEDAGRVPDDAARTGGPAASGRPASGRPASGRPAASGGLVTPGSPPPGHEDTEGEPW